MTYRYDPFEAVFVAGYSLSKHFVSGIERNSASHADHVFVGTFFASIVVSCIASDLYFLILEHSAAHALFDALWPVNDPMLGNLGSALSPDRAFHFVLTIVAFAASFSFYGQKQSAVRLARWDGDRLAYLRMPVCVASVLILVATAFESLPATLAAHVWLLVFIVSLANRADES